MRKLLVGVFALLSVAQIASASLAIAPQRSLVVVPEVIKETRELSVNELVTLYSSEFGVSENTMKRIIDCEDPRHDPIKQSEVIYNFSDPKRGIVAGTRERSFGLVQIHLPDHKSISYEEATNPEFSIEFLARELSKGNGRIWSCF